MSDNPPCLVRLGTGEVVACGQEPPPVEPVAETPPAVEPESVTPAAAPEAPNNEQGCMPGYEHLCKKPGADEGLGLRTDLPLDAYH